MSEADLGYSTKFEVDDGTGTDTFVELAEVYSVTPPEVSVDTVEATHFQSPGRSREFIPALSDHGTAQAEMNFIPDSPTDQRLLELRASGETVPMQITFPNGVMIEFSGFVTSYNQSIPVDDRMTATAQFKVTGEVTVTSAT